MPGRFHIPFRLKELEAAYFQLQTTGLPSTIRNSEGGHYIVTTADLAALKHDITHLQSSQMLTHTIPPLFSPS